MKETWKGITDRAAIAEIVKKGKYREHLQFYRIVDSVLWLQISTAKNRGGVK